MTARRRVHAGVRGVVQGVGFRPFVYTQATLLGLSGWVRNDSSGAIIEVEGGNDALERFLDVLRHHPPPLAVIDSIDVRYIAVTGGTGFTIVDTSRTDGRRTHPRLAGRRDVRRMRCRAAGSAQPAVPARVRQLHKLRSAVHAHRLATVRPSVDDHGGFRDVRRLRA